MQIILPLFFPPKLSEIVGAAPPPFDHGRRSDIVETSVCEPPDKCVLKKSSHQTLGKQVLKPKEPPGSSDDAFGQEHPV